MNAMLSFFSASLKETPDAPALQVNGAVYSYAALAQEAARYQKILSAQALQPGAPVALYSARTLSAYAGILACAAQGNPWVPLNPEFPDERNHAILERSNATLIIADETHATPKANFFTSCTSCEVVFSSNLPEYDEHDSELVWREIQEDAIAYILFTSGTTGVPKGIPITHGNLSAYIRNFNTLFPLEKGLRYSQLFDLTFDLSIHDMTIAWSNGGCLVVPTSFDVLMPVHYVRRQQIDVWFSVPSLASMAAQSGLLRPGAMPSLKYSFFCGEALPTTTVRKWFDAAPNSSVTNLYGPTEATIAITHYSFDRDADHWIALPVAPIGTPYPGQGAIVVDEHDAIAADGVAGELWLGGTQLFSGYLNDEEKTRHVLMHRQFDGIPNKVWYRTGDIATMTNKHGLRYLGRVDRQTKIHGYRVELQEVEHILRQAAQSDLVAVVPWPRQETGSYGGLVAFIVGSPLDTETILHTAAERLPAYMCPSSVQRLASLPVNANGKIDYRALATQLDANKA